jgi:hypothetical protein
MRRAGAPTCIHQRRHSDFRDDHAKEAWHFISRPCSISPLGCFNIIIACANGFLSGKCATRRLDCACARHAFILTRLIGQYIEDVVKLGVRSCASLRTDDAAQSACFVPANTRNAGRRTVGPGTVLLHAAPPVSSLESGPGPHSPFPRLTHNAV